MTKIKVICTAHHLSTLSTLRFTNCMHVQKQNNDVRKTPQFKNNNT